MDVVGYIENDDMLASSLTLEKWLAEEPQPHRKEETIDADCTVIKDLPSIKS